MGISTSAGTWAMDMRKHAIDRMRATRMLPLAYQVFIT